MRVLVYLPVTRSDGRYREWIEEIEAVRKLLESSGGKLTLLAEAQDACAIPIPWPKRGLEIARVDPPTRFESGAFIDATEEAFAQLGNLLPGHDVVWVPQPLGALPWNLAAEFGIPVVIGLHHRDFDAVDLGARTDRCRRELTSAFRMANGFLFTTPSLRDWAARIDPVSLGNGAIAPTVGSRLATPRCVAVELGLPERYLFAAGLARAPGDPAPIAAALASVFAPHGVRLPIVWVHERRDLPPCASLGQMERAEAIRAAFRAAGMEPEREWFECRELEEWAYRGLLAGASAVLGIAESDGGPDWTAMSAHRSGLRVVHPQWEAGAIRPGTSWPFDPAAAGDLNRALGEALASPAAPSDGSAEAAARTILGVLEKAIVEFRILPSPVVRPPKPRDGRVAWLISHTTLRDAEVPLLRELGYEVFTNKVLPGGEEYRSGSADSSWDDDSTLPRDLLRLFNRTNFYQTEFTSEIADGLNEFFGTVISAAYPPLIRQLVLHYRGRILVRVFGREHPLCYGEYINFVACGRRLWEIQRRFWFAACYEQIPEYEGPFLRERAAVLPVALPDRALRTAGRWRGGDRRIFFVCPSIGSSPTYYGKIYSRFREVFGDFPHVIAGSQPVPVDDPNVTGFLTEERFMHLFETMRVMYYHSREPRHIHYHPLEAIVYGMPVVYLRGGLMEHHDTGSQAGACDTEDEAREKLRRVLDGDADLIRAIQASQASILDIFLPAYNLETWRRIFHDTAAMPTEPAGLRDARPGSIAPAPPEPDWFAPLAASPLHMLTRERLERLAPTSPAASAPPPVSARKALARRWIPEPLHPTARTAYRVLRSAKRLLRAKPGIGPRELELTGHLGHALPAGASGTGGEPQALTPIPPAEVLPALAEPTFDLTRLRSILQSDGVNFALDPVGRLDPNLPIPDRAIRNLVVAFTELPWESEECHGSASQAACRQAMLWCRSAQHAIFATDADRALAVHRYGLDPIRTSTLPVLTLTEFPFPFLTKPRPPEEVDGLPARYLLGWCADFTNTNGRVLLDALAHLRRRKFPAPPIVLAEHPPFREWGRRGDRIGRGIRERLGRPGFAEAQHYFHLDGIAEDEHQWLLHRGAIVSISIRRWGSVVVREIVRAALARIPCIATAIPAVVEAFGPPHENLLLVDPNDSVALARAIEMSLEDSDENRRRIDGAERIAKRLAKPDDFTPKERLARAVAGRLAVG